MPTNKQKVRADNGDEEAKKDAARLKFAQDGKVVTGTHLNRPAGKTDKNFEVRVDDWTPKMDKVEGGCKLSKFYLEPGII